MKDMASTSAEANEHLQQLREARGGKEVDSDIYNNVLVESLNEALDLLSDQLYTKPTHFLLELIQNADDNTYPSRAVPRLHLSLHGKAGKEIFRSDCNEVGFTFQQLDALTRIGKSTKKAADGRKGYIGEKGIGFKSVFKVADVVHVASGCYEFKLNRRHTIGMMLPISSNFPSGHRVKNHTQFLLELKRNEDYTQIRGDLEGLGPEILLFLRKLKELDVTINEDVTINDKLKTYKLETNLLDHTFGGETAMVLETTFPDQQIKTTKYVVERQIVGDLPPNPRRKGVNTSEVIVAFAVKDRIKPNVKRQHVFAFLPIQNYGFPFLIHADFLLTASRESLEDQCPWNLALRDGIKDAVVDMIYKRFIHLEEVYEAPIYKGLCYSWPKYLKRQPSGSQFWNTLHEIILVALRSKRILQSRHREAVHDFQKPTVVRYIPEEYRLDGETLFDLPSINKTHLSFNYDNVKENLGCIGVSKLSLRDLCDEFCEWVGSFGIAGLKEKPDKWHSKVAETFLSGSLAPPDRKRLKDLPIIPLRSGSWVRATESHLYLPSQNKNEHVPNGIEISIVAEDAARDAPRKKLYEYLDIKEYNPGQVCQLILELHRRLASDRRGRLVGELIADAMYLFEHRSELDSNGPPDIFFAVHENDHNDGHNDGQNDSHKNGKIKAKRSPRIYVTYQLKELKYDVIAKYKDTRGNPFHVLSNAYEEELIKRGTRKLFPQFREWLLRSSTTFATIPDLVRNSRLTPEWNFLRDENVVDLLHVVRAQLSSTLISATKLVEDVPRLQLRCLDGESRMLGELAIPTPDLRLHCPHLDFADLPEPTHDWKFLSQFGVITELDTPAILRELQALRNKIPATDVDASAVRRLYEVLNSDVRTSQDQIVRAFEAEPLVFVPQRKPEWLSHKDCVWTAPKLLTRVTKLRSHYLGCEILFNSLLGVRKSGIEHVIDEFCEPTSGGADNIEQRFLAILSLLAKFHGNSSLTEDQKNKICSASVFPILAKGSTPVDGLSRIEMRSLLDKHWYIPDVVAFDSVFRDKIDILALPVESAKALKGLFEDLGCEKEFLSVAVKRTPKPHGITVHNIHEEQDLHERLKYVFRVIEANLEGDVPDISSIRVLSVPSIIVTLSLPDVEVIIDDDLVTVERSMEAIDIYLRQGTHESKQTEVRYELLRRLVETIGVDLKDSGLISLLMVPGVPLNSLPGILEKHDISLPEISQDDTDGDSGEETSDPENDHALAEECNLPLHGSDRSHGSRGDNISTREGSRSRTESMPTESGKSTHAEPRKRSSRTTRAARCNDPPPLREVIPSHQSRSENIIKMASAFRLSDAEAASPIQYHSESGAAPLHFSLPIRTRRTGGNADENSNSSPRGMPATGGAYNRSLGGGGYSSSRSRRESSGVTYGVGADETGEIRTREIGYLGELFVFEMFNQMDDWTFKCWTSRLRSDAGHPPFEDLERDFSDFTYDDASGQMKAMLCKAGIVPSPAWSNSTKFHLEVKSTLGSSDEPMFISQNQVDKMRKFNGTADNAYILIRVFDLDEGRSPGVKFFRDPWSLYLDGVLKFKSDEGYKVYQ